MSEQQYLVTARKYRPQVFADLVAQDHVSETLKNAIRLNRLAHLYLFSGPRGVGKTTAARILAKAINCTAPTEERVDGTEPCRKCDSCRAFEEGRSLSIFEIDAASNNKAEDMRELRDTVRIPPQGGKRKVYIVDEVHMLSTAAFNVLLKTLEEPPPYVLFIFATTEPHKVLSTILSRCQRFDFKRIPVDEIVESLRGICAEEGVEADDASLMLIARKGDGALRDSLSVFDQAVALCGNRLSYEELASALGVVDIDLFFKVTDAAIANDSAAMLYIVDEIVRTGHDFQEFLGGLAEHLRSLLITVTTGDTALIEGVEEVKQRYLETGKSLSEPDLLRMLMIAATAEGEIRGSTQPRLRLELALLKIAALTSAVDLRKLIKQVESGDVPHAVNEGDKPKPAPQVRPEHKPETPKPSPTAKVAEPTPAPTKPASPPPDDRPPLPEDPPEFQSRPSPPPSPAPIERPAPAKSPDADIRTKVFGGPALKVKRRPTDDGPQSAMDGNLAGDGAEVAIAEPSVSISAHELRAAWEAACLVLSESRVRVSALMKQSTIVEADEDVLVIEVPADFHRRELQSVQEDILPEVSSALDRAITELRFVIRERTVDQDGVETDAPADPYQFLMQKREENEVLQALFEDFGGEYTA
jgi:DNA polymerase III subunit gamma/tau